MSETQPSRETRCGRDQEEEELACRYCHERIYDAYFEVNGETSCQKCRYDVEEQRLGGSRVGRFVRAAFAGSLAAAVGAGIQYAVLAITDYEFALISIVVGLMVGFAVSWGSAYRGGWVYQTLAVGLTYLAIVSAYVPVALEGWEDESASRTTLGEESDGTLPRASAAVQPEILGPVLPGDAVMGLAAFVLMVAAIPFLAGVENVLGLLIIGFGLFEAWRLNQFQPLRIEGPFRSGKVWTSEQ